MRTLALILTVPCVLGCAQQPPVNTAAAPFDQPLTVTLHPPRNGVYSYTLSEPAYVAIFAASRGRGISLAFPHFGGQAGHRGHAGLNMDPPQGAGRFVMPTTPSEDRDRARYFFGHTDAYYIFASRDPLPLEEMLESPYFLRRLLGDDLFRANDLSRTRVALQDALIAHLPRTHWASAVYYSVRSPFQLTASDTRDGWPQIRGPW